MSSLGNLFLHHEKVGRAKADYSRAAACLENALIMERLAEIKSQHEPLASMIGQGDVTDPVYQKERDRLYSAAYYVVVGRLPENQHA